MLWVKNLAWWTWQLVSPKINTVNGCKWLIYMTSTWIKQNQNCKWYNSLTHPHFWTSRWSFTLTHIRTHFKICRYRTNVFHLVSMVGLNMWQNIRLWPIPISNHPTVRPKYNHQPSPAPQIGQHVWTWASKVQTATAACEHVIACKVCSFNPTTCPSSINNTVVNPCPALYIYMKFTILLPVGPWFDYFGDPNNFYLQHAVSQKYID